MKLKLYEPQPAYLLYPVDRGWRIMRYVWEHVFIRTGVAAKEWQTRGDAFQASAAAKSSAAMKYWITCCAVGCYVAGGSQYLSAMLFVAVFVAVQFLALSLWATGSVLVIGALSGATRIFSAVYRLFYRCPGCHESMTIPVFSCPGCATEHTRLWPSLYGILKHTCRECGASLATVEWFGRHRLARNCPHCARPLTADIGTLTNVHVPVVGGPSTGKSNLIVQATHELIEECRATGLAAAAFSDAKDEQEFRASLGRLQAGRELLKTTDIVPQAFNLSLKRAKETVGKIVYFYDAAGEAYGDEASAQKQRYYRYVNGVVLVIDPFSLPDVRSEFGERIEDVRLALRPGSLGAMEAYERMLAVLEANVGVRRGRRFPHPLAVVITKTDALGLEDRIGAPAAARYLAAHPAVRGERDAIDALVREFFGQYGLDHFVRDAQLQFSRLRFFSCSALGRMPEPADSRPFTSLRALEPLRWVLEELRVLDASRATVAGAVAAGTATAAAQA